MTSTHEKVTVEIWSDVICPFCWIGLTKLDKALAGFAHREQVQVLHHAYRLLPGMHPVAAETLLIKKFSSEAEMHAGLAKVERSAAELGLVYKLTGSRLGDTMDAHRLLKLADSKGLGEKALVRFFRGFYSEGADLFERESLITLATQAGLDRWDVEAVLDSDAYQGAVELDKERFALLGGKGTPFIVIDGRPLSSGQEVASLSAALAEAWDRRQVAITTAA
jgi:predicted DsbA family dithiol-disulfide isomerase